MPVVRVTESRASGGAAPLSVEGTAAVSPMRTPVAMKNESIYFLIGGLTLATVILYFIRAYTFELSVLVLLSCLVIVNAGGVLE